MGKVYQNQYVILRQMQERARENDPLSLSSRTRLAYERRSSYFTTAGHCTCLSQEWMPLVPQFKILQSVIIFFKIDTLIQKGCITLMKSDSKYFYMVTKNKSCTLEFFIQQIISEKKSIIFVKKKLIIIIILKYQISLKTVVVTAEYSALPSQEYITITRNNYFKIS